MSAFSKGKNRHKCWNVLAWVSKSEVNDHLGGGAWVRWRQNETCRERNVKRSNTFWKKTSELLSHCVWFLDARRILWYETLILSSLVYNLESDSSHIWNRSYWWGLSAQSSFSGSFVSNRLFDILSACFISAYQREGKHKFQRKRKNSQPGIHLVFISYTQSNSIQCKSKWLKVPIYQFAVGKDRVPYSQALPRLWPRIWILLSHTQICTHIVLSNT